MEAYKELLKQKEEERQKRVAEKRSTELRKKKERQAQYKEQEWESMTTLETEIKDMEARLDSEFGKESHYEDDDIDASSDLFCVACNKLFRTAKAMANHEKSKKHKENLAALKLILQEETGGVQSLSDSDGSYSVDDSIAKCDRLSDNSDTHSDTVDEHGDTGNDRGLSDTTQQLPNNTTNDRLDNHSVPSTDKGPNNDGIISEDEDDILLLLAKNKTKQASGYHEDKFKPVSMETSNKPEENTTQDEREEESCKKAKKKKKSANVKPASGDPSLLCHKCSREFPSRNKLFQHIKETGHALRTTSSSAVTPTDFGKKNKKKHSLHN